MNTKEEIKAKSSSAAATAAPAVAAPLLEPTAEQGSAFVASLVRAAAIIHGGPKQNKYDRNHPYNIEELEGNMRAFFGPHPKPETVVSIPERPVVRGILDGRGELVIPEGDEGRIGIKTGDGSFERLFPPQGSVDHRMRIMGVLHMRKYLEAGKWMPMTLEKGETRQTPEGKEFVVTQKPGTFLEQVKHNVDMSDDFKRQWEKTVKTGTKTTEELLCWLVSEIDVRIDPADTIKYASSDLAKDAAYYAVAAYILETGMRGAALVAFVLFELRPPVGKFSPESYLEILSRAVKEVLQYDVDKVQGKHAFYRTRF